MADGGRKNNLDAHGLYGQSPAALRHDLPIKPTLSEADFGLGISDSAYRPQTWSGMGKLFQQETLSDVMLIAEGQSIPCHKFLLAAASEYFYNKIVEDTSFVNYGLIEIEGISFSALKVIVSYLYTGNINITEENASDVIPACKVLKLQSAYNICEKFALNAAVNPGNCIAFYKLSMANGIQQLFAKSLSVMVRDFTEVVTGSDFLAMSENDVADYIQNENLKIGNEDPVFEAVVSWVRHQPQKRKSSFSRLLTHVRLRYCSPHYLSQVVSKEPLMETRECQKILVEAFIHQSSANVQTHQASGSSNQQNAAPRKGYTRTATLMTIGGISDPGNIIRPNCWRLEETGWRVMGQCPMPVSVPMFSACVVTEGIVVTGGYSDCKPVSQCWLLSTSTYQWSSLPDMNTARARHASVCVGGQSYVIAGEGEDGKGMSSGEYLQNFSADWETLPDLPKALVHPMAVSHGQYIYVFGGINMKDKDSQSVFVYGTNSKSWQTLADMPQVCMLGSAVMWKDKIYIVGGFQQSCICYNPVLAQWRTLCQCRHEHADGSALVWRNKILICGGRSRKAKRTDGASGGTTVIEEYDPETDTWTVSQIELPQKLSSHFVFSTEPLGHIV